VRLDRFHSVFDPAMCRPTKRYTRRRHSRKNARRLPKPPGQPSCWRSAGVARRSLPDGHCRVLAGPVSLKSEPGLACCADALLGCGPAMMARNCGPLARIVARLYRSRTGLVARIVLRTDLCRVGVFWDTGKAMGEVVQEPHD
jgi:hypothetical protein